MTCSSEKKPFRANRQMIGAPCPVCLLVICSAGCDCLRLFTENMAQHRAQLLSSLLVNAMRFGAAEVEPDIEPLRVSQSVLVNVTER